MTDDGGAGGGPRSGSMDGGAFLLQLLRQPPQTKPQSDSPAPSHFGSASHPHGDPAVAAMGPSFQFPPHTLLRPPPPPADLQPTVPIAQGFLQNHWTPQQPSGYLPGVHGSFPLFRGEILQQVLPPGCLMPRPPAAQFAGDPRRDPRYPPYQDAMSMNHAQRHHSSCSKSLAYASEGQIMANTNYGSRKTPASGPNAGGFEQHASEPKAPVFRSHNPHDRSHSQPHKPAVPERQKFPGTMSRPKKVENWIAVCERREESLNLKPQPEKLPLKSKQPNSSKSECGASGGILLDMIRSERGLDSSNPESIASSVSARRRGGDLLEEEHAEDVHSDSSGEDVVEDGVVLQKEIHVATDNFIEDGINSLAITDSSVNSMTKQVKTSRGKDLRYDSLRGHNVSGLRARMRRRSVACRYDIDIFTPGLLSIFRSLVPAEEEKAKQRKLLASLEELVTKEWPNAQLHLYGSCANSFGVSNSDIDVCLAIDDNTLSKPDILSRLADILKSSNLQNVQALLHARVPVVKLMDPTTGISCDICINNMLAVVNTKLLRDYAQIDERLRQLAFIVKHWAKSRGINETYRGTLSSYAYVLMCIHFLQQRQPAILPCLQRLNATYTVTMDGTDCAFFDQVEKLSNFGSHNKESIGYLLWAFFCYWAYCHDYANDVISVRTGRIISKREKDWTRRIGNDRHLICLEDPFETQHDLGRVVDKFSIKILREEFERAADVLQYDRNPCVTLFEPYIRSSPQDTQTSPAGLG